MSLLQLSETLTVTSQSRCYSLVCSSATTHLVVIVVQAAFDSAWHFCWVTKFTPCGRTKSSDWWCYATFEAANVRKVSYIYVYFWQPWCNICPPDWRIFAHMCRVGFVGLVLLLMHSQQQLSAAEVAFEQGIILHACHASMLFQKPWWWASRVG